MNKCPLCSSVIMEGMGHVCLKETKENGVVLKFPRHKKPPYSKDRIPPKDFGAGFTSIMVKHPDFISFVAGDDGLVFEFKACTVRIIGDVSYFVDPTKSSESEPTQEVDDG